MLKTITCALFLLLSTGLSAQSAIGYLQQHYEKLGLEAADVQELTVTDDYPSPNGIRHVYVQQRYRGIPIRNAQAALHYRGSTLVYQTNRLFSGLAASEVDVSPTLPAATALVRAARTLDVTVAGIARPQGREADRQVFAWEEVSREPLTAALRLIPVSGKLRLCWEVYLDQIGTADQWIIHVDAHTGTVVNRFNRTIYCSFNAPNRSGLKKHRHNHRCQVNAPTDNFHEKAMTTLVDDGSSYRVFPFGIDSPIYGDRVLETNPADSLASPFGWHDTNGQPGPEHTTLRGNNVRAYADRNNDNTPDSDVTVDGGDSLQFDFFYEDLASPDTLLAAGLTQLFYITNKVHDFTYAHGFDEAAGNFQERNYSGEGENNDPVRAEAQDGADFNNANFATPPDGGPGRMQMFLWVNDGVTSLTVDAPAEVAGPVDAAGASFGAQTWAEDITGKIVVTVDNTNNPERVCEAVANPEEVAGNIALIRRGDCFFETKTLNAQAAGAVAVIICNPDNDLFTMGGGVDGNDPNIPAVMMREEDCAPLRAAIAAGDSVILTIPANAQLDTLVGDFDNGVVAHEYGHGISNRLVGGPANDGCLGNQEQMGEGWSDFFMLVTTPRNAAEQLPDGSEPRGIGNFVSGRTPTGGGIRRLPYSTDMAVNDHTYDAIITSGIPHNLGEIWATTLWDMYWALVDVHGFDDDLINGDGGNNIAVRLVIEGMKYTECNPGMVNGRNGILVADELLYEGRNSCLIWEVFARRGLGHLATQGSSNNIGDGRENFEVLPSCFKTVKLRKQSDVDVIVAGDPVTFTLTVTNDKEEDVKGITVTDEIPPGMSVDPASINGIEGFTIGDGFISFNVGTVEADEQAIFSYAVTTDPGLRSVSHFFDGAETGDENWDIFPLNGEGVAIWDRTDEEVFEGDFAWFVENVSADNDQVLEMLEPLELTGNQPAVRFYTQYDTEAGWDGGIVEMSIDGINWTNVGQDRFLRGEYRGEVATSAFDNSVTDFNAYWGDSDGYFDSYLDFSDMAGQSVYLRWRFGSDEEVGTVGWWVDNIELVDLFRYTPKASLSSEQNDVAEAVLRDGGVMVDTDFDTDVVDPELGETRVTVFPNPAKHQVNVYVKTENRGAIKLRLLSVDGRVLQTRTATNATGEERFRLNVSALPAGMYILQLSGADRFHTERISIQ